MTSEYLEIPHLQIVRKFDVVPEIVFDAFTKPESMRVWWTNDTTFDVDLQVGSHWTIVRHEEGQTYTATGKYLEIERPHHLKYTYAMPQFSPNSDIISVDIAADGETGSILTFTETGIDIAEELKELPPGDISESEKGWQQGFDLMAKAWAK